MDSYRNWAEIPTDLLNEIQVKLGNFFDYIRFCSVCELWRTVGLSNNNFHRQSLQVLKASRNKLPVLITQTKENSGPGDLYSFTEGVTYDLKLLWAHDCRIFGSSLGWLFTIDKTLAITIVNPFTGASIPLPVITGSGTAEVDYYPDVYNWYCTKGILSSNPTVTPNNFTVVISYGKNHELAVYKPGYDRWKHIKGTFMDFIFYKGHVFGVSHGNNSPVKINVDNGGIDKVGEKSNFYDELHLRKLNYLVESVDGDLLVIQRRFRIFLYENELLPIEIFLKVFKFDNEDEKNSLGGWLEINDLGDQAIFIGDNQSVSVSIIEFPECRGNCIYFTDGRNVYNRTCKDWDYAEDPQVFSLEDGTFHSLYKHESSKRHLLPPIWFVPNLREHKNSLD